MSQALFPGTIAAMPGLAWSVVKVPSFNSKIQTSVGNAELRASFTPYPRWSYTLKFTVLRAYTPYTEFQTLAGFYLARRGAYDSFLYDDPSDDAVVDQQFGTGDGVTTQFQLLRTLGSFAEFIYNVNAITNVKIATVPTALYTISNGLITFNSPPANGAALTWTGSYYWRVRFADDTATFEEFANAFWANNSLSFISIIGS